MTFLGLLGAQRMKFLGVPGSPSMTVPGVARDTVDARGPKGTQIIVPGVPGTQCITVPEAQRMAVPGVPGALRMTFPEA